MLLGEELQKGVLVADRFEIVHPLGRGGMGTIYLAEDLRLDLEVALKVMQVEGQDEPSMRMALYKEVKLARLINHPNVARIYDLGEWAGLAFLSMEFIKGVDLAYLLEVQGQMSIDEGKRVLFQLCSGLAAAHAAGIVHRDLKPSNIMQEKNGRVVILDFGIAKLVSNLQSTSAVEWKTIGVPHYTAPEQFSGSAVDHRADIYSLGIIAYELFSGRTPFVGNNMTELAQKHLEDPVPDILLAKPDLPPRLAAIICRCLEKDPRHRFGAVSEILTLLSEPELAKERDHPKISAQTTNV